MNDPAMSGHRETGTFEKPHRTSLFTRRLVSANRLQDDGFRAWLFYPGMFFMDENKWWGDRVRRRAAHEGVDFCFYRTTAGDEHRLQPQTRIPALADGRVLAVIEDFLGKSIIMHHPAWEDVCGRVCTIYGHTEPVAGLSVGDRLDAGDLVARLADVPRAGGPGPHLHVSLALIDRRLAPQNLNWRVLGNPATTLFLDPLDPVSAPQLP